MSAVVVIAGEAGEAGLIPICPQCGLEVVRDATARWNPGGAYWELDAIQESYWCDGCGLSGGPIEWREGERVEDNEGLTDGAGVPIRLDGGATRREVLE